MIKIKPHLLSEQELNEMAIQVVSSREDELPFRIAIKAPDHKPPHAHVMDLATGKKELGQFLISENPPQKAEDIKDYKKGLLDEMWSDIFKWSKWSYKGFPALSNWDALNIFWRPNEKW
jgi:hypothetical protein